MLSTEILYLRAKRSAYDPGSAYIVISGHDRKASAAISVTLTGIVTASSELQFLKAHSPIVLTPSGIVISLSAAHPQNSSFLMRSIPAGKAICSRAVQSAKAPTPMPVTLPGMTASVKSFLPA